MDLEEIARRLYKENLPYETMKRRIEGYGVHGELAEALLKEIKNSEALEGLDSELKKLINFQPTGLEAGKAGLGSRGMGDFIIHHSIARIAGGNPVVGPAAQDDGGVVRLPDGKFLVVSVDGLHSRLGHFPFLAGFHVARACIRDVLMMGGEPVALFSDVHLADNGDPAIILDYTSGIATVGEATGVPLVSGSTLRIGGDLVRGDRLSGAAGAVGISHHITPRSGAKPGDVIVMTEGSGGGTIAATAIFNGMPEVVESTLNLRFIRFTEKFLRTSMMKEVHAMTDVTNGGIKGDAYEIARATKLDIFIDKKAFLSLVNSQVRKMLLSLNIDPFGVSIDSLLVISPEDIAEEILSFMKKEGMKGRMIGRVEKGAGYVFLETESGKEKILPAYREAPYTPVKVVMDKELTDAETVKSRMREAVERALKKKEIMLRRLEKEGINN